MMTIEQDIEDNKKKLELLKLARHMVNEQYLKDRAGAYVQWSTDSDRVWKEQGIKLPFPPTPPMPSEADVVAKALDLYNHINTPKTEAVVPEPTPDTVAEIKPELAPAVKAEPVVEPTPEPAVKAEPVVEPTPEPAVKAEPVVEPTPEPAVKAEPITVPDIVQPIVAVPGPADLTVAESAIKALIPTPATPPRSESVIPLIKGMLKKGLLPSWVKSDEETK
jgi:outer membrane biosynthesis protein TonB